MAKNVVDYVSVKNAGINRSNLVSKQIFKTFGNFLII